MNERDYDTGTAFCGLTSRFIFIAQSITPQIVIACPNITPELGARLRLSILIAALSESMLGTDISYSYPLFFMPLPPLQSNV
jgi:hypothetical protein